MKAYQDHVLSAGTFGTLRTRRIILEFRLSSAKSGENWGWDGGVQVVNVDFIFRHGRADLVGLRSVGRLRGVRSLVQNYRRGASRRMTTQAAMGALTVLYSTQTQRDWIV
jgi:hypothetical protein